MQVGTTEAAAGSGGRSDSMPWVALAVALVAAGAFLLWRTADNTLIADEVEFFERIGADASVSDTFHPHRGHLIAAGLLIYNAVFSTVGPDYGVIRVLSVLVVLANALVLFCLLRRRVPAIVALAPTAVLLVLGSAWEGLLWPASVLTFGLAVAFGLTALAALERRDRGGDIAACALIAASVCSHTTGLAFLAGAALALLLRDDRLERAWIVMLPALAYGVWWVWSRQFADTDLIEPLNVLLIPSFAINSLAAVLASVTGLSADLDSIGTDRIVFTSGWGQVLAVIAVVALGLRLARGRVPRPLWVALAVLAVYWTLLALVLDPSDHRVPETNRYIYPAAVLVVLVAGAAAGGLRFPRPAVVAVLAIAAFSLMTNVRQLLDTERVLSSYATLARTDLAMVELGGDAIPPELTFNALPELQGPVPEQLPATVGPYLDAVDRFGSFAYSIDEIRKQSADTRSAADRVLARLLGLSLQPVEEPPPPRRCTGLILDPVAPEQLELVAGGTYLLASAAVRVSLGRFADDHPVELGELDGDAPVVLAIPPDANGDAADLPWRLLLAGSGRIDVCEPAAAAG